MAGTESQADVVLDKCKIEVGRLCILTLSISQSVSCVSFSCLNMIATTHSQFTHRLPTLGIFDLVGRVDVAVTRTYIRAASVATRSKEDSLRSS